MTEQFQTQMPRLSLTQLDVPNVYQLYIGGQGFGKGSSARKKRLSELIHGDTKAAKALELSIRLAGRRNHGTS